MLTTFVQDYTETDNEAYSWNTRHSDLQHSFKQSVRGVNSVSRSVLPASHFNYFQIFFMFVFCSVSVCNHLNCGAVGFFFKEPFALTGGPELLHLSSMLYLVWRMAALGPALCVMLDEMHFSQSEPFFTVSTVHRVPPRACATLPATACVRVGRQSSEHHSAVHIMGR